MSEKDSISKAVREAMKACLIEGVEEAEITCTLGDIPWKITVEIDAEKVQEQTND